MSRPSRDRKRNKTTAMTAAWEVEKETRIDRVVMHLESLHFAITINQGRMDELKDQLGCAVARLVQLKPDCTDELKDALRRAQEHRAKLKASEDSDCGAAPATDV
jgi:hypothetical protein